jgi:hypothetical protein
MKTPSSVSTTGSRTRSVWPGHSRSTPARGNSCWKCSQRPCASFWLITLNRHDATPFMLVSTFKVKEGSLENLRDFSRRVTELMQATEPRIIAFHCFLSEDGTEMSTIHLHPDVASMEFHMQVQRDNWEETFSQSATMLANSPCSPRPVGRRRAQALVCHCGGAALLGYVLAWHGRRISSTTCSIGAVASMTTPFSGTSSFVWCHRTMSSRSVGFPPPHSSSGRSSSRRCNVARSTSRTKTPSNRSIISRSSLSHRKRM